ncbi:hypothetical protein TNCV_1054541 [Trichonephila clavipes]|nr:hypothetical protein TNCV_1054541 [Trichonephila clavipes]
MRLSMSWCEAARTTSNRNQSLSGTAEEVCMSGQLFSNNQLDVFNMRQNRKGSRSGWQCNKVGGKDLDTSCQYRQV